MDPRPLPPGFISQYDQNTQRYYYVDTRTGISQWHHPLDMNQYPPPPVGQTSSQYPSPSPNPNSQGNYPLGYSDQRPPSNYPPSNTNPYAMQQQSSSSYPQPTPSNYPPSYQQSGPYGSGEKRTETYPYSSQPNYQAGYNPQNQSYVGAPSPPPSQIQGPPGDKEQKGGIGGMGKMLIGAGLGAAGGLLAGTLFEKEKEQHHGGHHHHGHHHHGHHHEHKGWW